MASFREVLKERRKEGSGVLSSLASATAGKTKEAIDIRNALFKSGSLLNALFPKVKGYSAIDRTPKTKTSPMSLVSGANATLMDEKLNIISKNTEISAKNSVVLPKMAYDTNLMRLNLSRLATVLTGKASRSPDAFFAAAKERENIYERQFGRSRAPTAVAQPGTKEESFLSSILKFLGGNLISMLIKGGLIAGILTALGKYFTDSEFKETVNGMVSKALEFIFGPDFKQKFQEKFDQILSDFSLGLLGVIAAFAGYKFILEGLKVAMVGLELALLKAQAALGAGGLLGALGPIMALGTAAWALYQLIKSDKRVTSTLEEAEKSGGWTPEQSSATTTEPMTTDEMVSGIRKGGLAGIYDDKAKEKEYQNETRKFLRQQSVPATSTSPTRMPQTDNDTVEQILATIKARESGGDYSAQSPSSSASGAYQYINDTWQRMTRKYNIGTEYARAKDAPPEIQDEVARRNVQDILKQVNGDITKVPNVWYTGNTEGRMTARQLAANKGLTAEQYQQSWMTAFNKAGTTQVALAGSATRPASSAISGGSIAMADSRMAMARPQPVVFNAPTTNVQQGNMSGGGSMPIGVVDSDFMKYLVDRAVTT